MTPVHQRSNTPRLLDMAWDEYRALKRMSYTGDQPDMDQRDIELIADLIFDLAEQLARLQVRLDTLEVKSGV